jgi:hypothetical protein
MTITLTFMLYVTIACCISFILGRRWAASSINTSKLKAKNAILVVSQKKNGNVFIDLLMTKETPANIQEVCARILLAMGSEEVWKQTELLFEEAIQREMKND